MDIGICLGTRIHTQQSSSVIDEREGDITVNFWFWISTHWHQNIARRTT